MIENLMLLNYINYFYIDIYCCIIKYIIYYNFYVKLIFLLPIYISWLYIRCKIFLLIHKNIHSAFIGFNYFKIDYNLNSLI